MNAPQCQIPWRDGLTAGMLRPHMRDHGRKMAVEVERADEMECATGDGQRPTAV